VVSHSLLPLPPQEPRVDFIDRHRRAQRVESGERDRAAGSLASSKTMDRCSALSVAKASDRLQRQMVALRADDIEFIAVVRGGVGYENPNSRGRARRIGVALHSRN